MVWVIKQANSWWWNGFDWSKYPQKAKKYTTKAAAVAEARGPLWRVPHLKVMRRKTRPAECSVTIEIRYTSDESKEVVLNRAVRSVIHEVMKVHP